MTLPRSTPTNRGAPWRSRRTAACGDVRGGGSRLCLYQKRPGALQRPAVPAGRAGLAAQSSRRSGPSCPRRSSRRSATHSTSSAASSQPAAPRRASLSERARSMTRSSSGSSSQAVTAAGGRAIPPRPCGAPDVAVLHDEVAVAGGAGPPVVDQPALRLRFPARRLVAEHHAAVGRAPGHAHRRRPPGRDLTQLPARVPRLILYATTHLLDGHCHDSADTRVTIQGLVAVEGDTCADTPGRLCRGPAGVQ